VFLAGVGLGGTVALVAAATDDRVAGVAVCNAFTPLRSGPRGATFVEELAERHGLVPRLGFFSGAEERIPVDFPEVLAAIAPRPALVIASQFDRHADHAAVAASVAAAGQVYRLVDAADRLQLIAAPNVNRFTAVEKPQVAAWIADQAAAGAGRLIRLTLEPRARTSPGQQRRGRDCPCPRSRRG
jgi:pimeloyl-ACP methyl ester carboxylesterase